MLPSHDIRLVAQPRQVADGSATGWGCDLRRRGAGRGRLERDGSEVSSKGNRSVGDASGAWGGKKTSRCSNRQCVEGYENPASSPIAKQGCGRMSSVRVVTNRDCFAQYVGGNGGIPPRGRRPRSGWMPGQEAKFCRVLPCTYGCPYN
jgi:hypothetical protein